MFIFLIIKVTVIILESINIHYNVLLGNSTWVLATIKTHFQYQKQTWSDTLVANQSMNQSFFNENMVLEAIKCSELKRAVLHVQ